VQVLTPVRDANSCIGRTALALAWLFTNGNRQARTEED
jgi:hypothetical protein